MLHAGGKFGGDGYKVSGGLHGVGVSVVNALSSRLARRGAHRRLRLAAELHASVCRTRPLKREEPTTETGTTITFWASDEIFETTDYSFETLSTRLREMAFLNKGLTISMTDERVVEAVEDEDDDAAESAPREVVYRYDDGLVDYVKHLNANKDAAHRSIISFEAEQAEPATATR